MKTVVWAAAVVAIVIYAIHLLWPLLVFLALMALVIRRYSSPRGRHRYHG